jgi:UDP-N-acetylglucosamine--N-acetylmuramyl-(pentapeptide) pyrophosphoryl-undecaprenol N-acetylglucosamine transferase
MRFILASGGTGGHLFPAVSLAKALRARGHDVLLITDTRGQSFPGLDQDIPLAVLPLGRYSSGVLQKASLAFSLIWAFLQTFWIVLKHRPDAIIGFGGFPSTPSMVVGWLLRKPLIVYDLNAYIGRVNRFFAPRVKCIATSFPQCYGIKDKYQSKLQYVGGIVRPEMQPKPYKIWTAKGPINVVIIGGSQGALSFNTIIPEAMNALPAAIKKQLQVTQQSKAPELQDLYKNMGITAEIHPFLINMNKLLQGAHLVICRAGGSTVAELMAMGRPAILIPYPHAMDDHQYYNAKNLEELGAGWIVREGPECIKELQTHLHRLLTHGEVLKEAAGQLKKIQGIQAVDNLANLIEQQLNKKVTL